MASISSSGSAPPSGAASQPATIAGATSTTASQAAAGATPGSFMQLVAQLLGGGGGAEPPSNDLGELAGVEISADQFELPGDDGDTESDTSDDDALALASLLPGLAVVTQPCPTPPADGTSAATAQSDDGAGAIDGANIAQRIDADSLKAAIDELAGDASPDAATLTQDAAAPPNSAAPSAAASPAQNAPPQLHALMTVHTAAGDVDITPDASLRSPVGSHAWRDELSTQLTWMALNGREAASLRLSPEHLGPLEVRISMHDGAASVYFGASNPDTRSALEQSLPRLRELFASNGLVLADAGVSRDSPRQAFKPPAESPRAARNIDASSGPAVTSVTLARAGLVDTYV
ncbi:MAG TPA: flagellar hook-length control protein FliK [Steroidobacteraceae bacterium]|nr:flagellar hook-length control protein FliK [Steroidobacteraceae bacterium]